MINVAKHISISKNINKTLSYNGIWSINIYPWLEALPWQLEQPELIFNNQTKNNSTFTNLIKN